ncbi:MATE family multidrug exporter [Poriferisphaera corsica]|uniref:MATE family multidrug exporter n=1 Tax=Poriferisphaera corsica TaxID=2528020 RepID=A0A517YYU9_9BACT|nr:MATE family efflux transporter [Poriferisphaera corsica]QDU35398.1 MATE family multidrug exporter [Poriferisphaera corsica]
MSSQEQPSSSCNPQDREDVVDAVDPVCPDDLAIARASDASEIPSDVIEGIKAGSETKQKELAGNLAGRSILSQIYILAIWPFLELLGTSFVGLVDIAIAGRLGGEQTIRALDSVGVAAYVTWLINMLFAAVGVGTGALVARHIGAREKLKANQVLGQAILLGSIWGAFVGILLYSSAPIFGVLFNLEGETLDLCTLYLRILAIASPLCAVVMLGCASLRSAGDTRTPFLVVVVISIVNVIASLALTFGPAPLGGYGVGGIAGGTAMAWLAGGLIILVTLVKGKGPDFISLARWRNYAGGDLRALSARHPISIRGGGPIDYAGVLPVRMRLMNLPLRLRKRWMKFDLPLSWRIVRIGIPSLIESSGMWLGNLAVAWMVGGLAVWHMEEVVDGVEGGVMGAHVVGIRIESLSFLPGMAIGIASATLVGQYLGLGDVKRAKKAAMTSWAIGAGLMGLMGLSFILMPNVYVSLLVGGKDAASVMMREKAVPLLVVVGFAQFFFGTYIVISQSLRGAGETVGPMILTYASTFFIRLPAAYVIGVMLGYGLTGIWVALSLELVVRGCVFFGWFQMGYWQKVKV